MTEPPYLVVVAFLLLACAVAYLQLRTKSKRVRLLEEESLDLRKAKVALEAEMMGIRASSNQNHTELKALRDRLNEEIQRNGEVARRMDQEREKSLLNAARSVALEDTVQRLYDEIEKLRISLEQAHSREEDLRGQIGRELQRRALFAERVADQSLNLKALMLRAQKYDRLLW